MHILNQTEPTLSYHATLIAIPLHVIRLTFRIMQIAITIRFIANTNYTSE